MTYQNPNLNQMLEHAAGINAQGYPMEKGAADAHEDSAVARLEPGEFPIHALSPAMRAIVEEVAEVHRVPVALPAMCAVGVVSGALGSAFTLVGAVNGKESYGNLYIIIAAPKSSGKGSVANVLVRPLLEASAELEADFKERQLPSLKSEKAVLEKRITVIVNELASNKTGVGKDRQAMSAIERTEAEHELQTANARLEAIEPLLAALPTYWVGNATSEAMAAQFKRNNCGLFCYSAEAGEVVRVLMGKYRGDGKADYDLALSGYSVEPWRSDRIGRGSCQITPCLSMLLLVQPSILREISDDAEAFERGMTARLLTFIVETEPLEDDGIYRYISEKAAADWNQLIRGILKRREALAGNLHRIICLPEAREIFRHFHNEGIQLRRGEYRDMEAELGRWRENAIRLGIALAVADSPEGVELTAEQATRAVDIARWCVRSGLQITDMARTQKRAMRVEELQTLLVRSGGRETLRNLDKSHGFTPEEIKATAGQFPERFTVERVKTGGRPSETLRLVLGARALN